MKKRRDHFLQEVTNHIKSKEAKKFVAAELEFHLKKAKNTWIEKGADEVDAEDKAVQQMGSPIKLGQTLNKLHRPRVDWLIIILLVTAMGLGFLPIVTLGNAGYMTVNHFLISKSLFVIIGIVAAIGIMMIDFRKLEKLGWLFYLIGVLLLLAINLFSTIAVNGEPVIKIGPFTLDSLLSLPFLFLAWASFFNNSSLKVWQHGTLFLFSLYLMLMIHNLPVAFIYTIMVFVMLWWSKLSEKKTLMLMAVGPTFLSISGGIYLWFFAGEYKLKRFIEFFNSNDENYLYLRLKELMSSAGWFGTTGKKEFIPSAHTDLVFATLTYYYGYLFAIILVLILSLMIARVVVISYKVNSHYAKLLLVGGITLFVVPFIYNIGMILGMFPVTSISLPFISYGMMPTLFNAFLMGVVLSIYRRKNLMGSSFN
ncbi:FtsW/RodA/SpoVE family cell cycle protein [Virgibacillus flavescens]|uniref:FtsW/RodA/SpoVE family cell cycle protein n=1 Tax=Virgibacillus flavescens TaxID=1611422 RepID=UPI003D347200